MERWILIITVIIPGIWSGNWKVTLTNQCALRGTSIVLQCTYDYPLGNIVQSVSWSKAIQVSGHLKQFPLSKLPSPPDHFNYIGNQRGDCNLKVNDVQFSDEGAYSFTFTTLFRTWESKSSAYLSVKELTAVVMPNTVTEGDAVKLICRSGCPKRVNIFWYRDGQQIFSSGFQARRQDAGRYYCAVSGQEAARSASVVLSVHYAPEKVTLAVSPSGDIIIGDTVTFTCSSDASPPVAQSGYSLYKDGEFISLGSTFVISDIQPSQSGRYHCQASNGISQRGSDLFYSEEINLDVQYRPMNITISVDPQYVVEGSSVNLTCSSAANPAADNYTWYKRTDSPGSSWLAPVGSGQVLSLPSMGASNTGFYFCNVRNRFGENKSTEVMLGMAEKQHGIQPIPVLVGIGVFLIVVLMVVLLLFWKNKQTTPHKKLTGRGTCAEHPPDAVYANIDKFAVSPLPVSAHAVTSQDSHHKASVSNEDLVTYSTVTIKPKNQSPQHHINNSRLSNNSSSSVRQNSNSVIYATVAKPS
ncbi:B-cell receptor CD22-like [Melanotaenia boesemani]|uniref:B-cell receptor CD22-like n=1 Tax=Melanotaenia boesemani TaxID=1250792 RepID=UPI001C04FE45|nr:B-cell receptor CD22-like [Melanotaenia boesemani]